MRRLAEYFNISPQVFLAKNLSGKSDLLKAMTTTQPHQDQINEQHTLWEVSDELWIRLAPVLVIDKPRKRAGVPHGTPAPSSTG